MGDQDDLDLIEFLRARIADDRDVLRAFDEFGAGRVPTQQATHDPRPTPHLRRRRSS